VPHDGATDPGASAALSAAARAMELQQWYAEKVGASLSMVDVGGGITLEVATAGSPAHPLVLCYHGFPSAACM
jgi:hypothetical protein